MIAAIGANAHLTNLAASSTAKAGVGGLPVLQQQASPAGAQGGPGDAQREQRSFAATLWSTARNISAFAPVTAVRSPRMQPILAISGAFAGRQARRARMLLQDRHQQCPLSLLPGNQSPPEAGAWASSLAAQASGFCPPSAPYLTP